MTKNLFTCLAAACVCLAVTSATPAHGAVYTFSGSAPDNGGGWPVSAKATFTVTNNQIVIELENLQDGGAKQNQAISGLTFEISGSPVGESFGGGTAIFVTLNADDSFALLNGGATVATTRWNLYASSADGAITSLGGGQPDEMIIGESVGVFPGTYPNADNGTDNFNPYLYQKATFVLTYTGGVLEDSTEISDVVVNFGTSLGEFELELLPPPPEGPDASMPEPASLAIWGLGLGLFGLGARRRMQKA